MISLKEKKKLLYRVRFNDPSAKKVYELLMEEMTPSDIMGLVCLSGLVFKDQTKRVLLPDEDEARKRFGKTERVHIPYQHLIMVEEVYEDETDVHNLPFLKSTQNPDIASEIGIPT